MGFAKSLSKFTDESVSRSLKNMGLTPEQREAKAKKQAIKLSVLDELGASFRSNITDRHAVQLAQWKQANPGLPADDSSPTYKTMAESWQLELDRHDRRYGLKK